MTYPCHPRKQTTSRLGVTGVRHIIESNDCIFTEIPQQNDLGVDAIVEIIWDQRTTGKCVALQIKSGKSYINENKKHCRIPIGNHRAYWENYVMPVIGVVFLPQERVGYWVDVKKYLKSDRAAKNIVYEANEINTLDPTRCGKYFIPYITRRVPKLEFDEAWRLFKASHPEENYVGLVVLYNHFADVKMVWKGFVDFIIEHDWYEIPDLLIYYVAHIPWHGDVAGVMLTKECRDYGQELLNELSKKQVVKLLECIDENGLERGAVGQSIAAIICSLADSKIVLEEIADDLTLEEEIRVWAVVVEREYCAGVRRSACTDRVIA